jgi:hypothetical protein
MSHRSYINRACNKHWSASITNVRHNFNLIYFMLTVDWELHSDRYRSGTRLDSTIGRSHQYIFLHFGQITMLIGLINLIRWISVPSQGRRRLQNILNFQTFQLLDPVSELRGWLKQKDIFFLMKWIITLSPAAHIKLSVDECIQSHRFPFFRLGNW